MGQILGARASLLINVRLPDAYPVASKKWQSKLGVIIFEFDNSRQSLDVGDDRCNDPERIKKQNAIRNICLRLWRFPYPT